MDQQIEDATPYGGTPIAPMLDDLLFFFGDHDAAKPFEEATGTGDPDFACRPKAAVLITDGTPNLGEEGFGYPYSHEAAAQLLAAGVKVHIVAFQLGEGSGPSWNPIADAGGTGPVVYVADKAEMYAAIENILDGLLDE